MVALFSSIALGTHKLSTNLVPLQAQILVQTLALSWTVEVKQWEKELMLSQKVLVVGPTMKWLKKEATSLPR